MESDQEILTYVAVRLFFLQKLVDACDRGDIIEVESLLGEAVDVNLKDLVN